MVVRSASVSGLTVSTTHLLVRKSGATAPKRIGISSM